MDWPPNFLGSAALGMVGSSLMLVRFLDGTSELSASSCWPINLTVSRSPLVGSKAVRQWSSLRIKRRDR